MPGVAGILATVVLVLIYIIVSFAAQAVKGPDFLADPTTPTTCSRHRAKSSSEPMAFGAIAIKLLFLAVLSSSAASCQTTILPAARTALSMAMHRAAPPKFGEVNPKYLTPAWSSWLFGIISCAWFVVLTVVVAYLGRRRAHAGRSCRSA